jgi:hypothetical protein
LGYRLGAAIVKVTVLAPAVMGAVPDDAIRLAGTEAVNVVAVLLVTVSPTLPGQA